MRITVVFWMSVLLHGIKDRYMMANEYQVRQDICDIGNRLWVKNFCAGNEGNISARIGSNEVLCTPTLVSKGFLKPSDICKVDFTGKQLSGNKPRTSEVMLHLEIFKARADINAIVHCHPPHLTAFAVTKRKIPMCVSPEMEIFVGNVPIAEYATPGTDELAKSILEHVDKANTVLLANHGAVSWAKSVEDAFFKMEIAESYCRMLMLAAQLGGASQLPTEQVKDLLDIKKELGITDPRITNGDYKDCDLCGNDTLGRGITCGNSGNPTNNVSTQQRELIVQKITDAVIERLQTK